MLVYFPYVGGLVYINPDHVKLVRAITPEQTLISFSGFPDEGDKQSIVVNVPVDKVVESLDE